MLKMLNVLKVKIECIEIDVLFFVLKCYLHILSIICLFFSCWSWLQLIGFFAGDLGRVDLMPGQWQVLLVSLAVIYPVAALGLWFRALWGIILWVIATVTQIVAFTIYSEKFVFMPILAGFLFVLLFIFVIINVMLYIKKRQKSVTLTEF